ncbi:MAG TPA: TIR domain-containing protein [Acetobacteraceae bacterium]|jgi:hypothetical protein
MDRPERLRTFTALTIYSGQIVSGSDDGTVRLWDADTGQELLRLEGHDGPVRCIATLSDGRIVSGGEDTTLRLWDVNTGRQLGRLVGHGGPVECVAGLSDGRIVSGSADRSLRLWDPSTCRELGRLDGHEGRILCVTTLAGAQIVSGGSDRTLRLWDANTGNEVRRLVGHQDWVRCVQLLANQQIVSGADDRTLRVWDLDRGTELHRLNGHLGWVLCVAVLSGEQIVSGAEDRSLRLWNVNEGRELRRFDGHGGAVTGVAVLPQGTIVSASYDGTLRRWNSDGEESIVLFSAPQGPPGGDSDAFRFDTEMRSMLALPLHSLRYGAFSAFSRRPSPDTRGTPPEGDEAPTDEPIRVVREPLLAMLEASAVETVTMARARTVVPPAKDLASFGASYPTCLQPAIDFITKVWVFPQSRRAYAESRALEEAARPTRFTSQGASWLERGTQLDVRLQIDQCAVTPATQGLVWTNDLTSVAFRVAPSADLPFGSVVLGEARVEIAGLRIADVKFEIPVNPNGPAAAAFAHGHAVRSGFASYASRDRWLVPGRVQGLEKAGINVFMDVHGLHSNDRYNDELFRQIDLADRLYLFWSRHAQRSAYVEREWRHGLQTRGLEFIDPVPLADPRHAKPPPELAGDKHFNDWVLFYERHEQTMGIRERLVRLLIRP